MTETDVWGYMWFTELAKISKTDLKDGFYSLFLKNETRELQSQDTEQENNCSMSIGRLELNSFSIIFHIPGFGFRKGSSGWPLLTPQAMKTCIQLVLSMIFLFFK